MKRIIKINYFLVIVITFMPQILYSAVTQVQAVGLTLNWPSPFGQPGYQIEVVYPSALAAGSSTSSSTAITAPGEPILDWMNSAYGGFYGLNSIQTSGYNSTVVSNSASPLFLRRPDLSKISSDTTTLYCWSDLLTAARITRRTFYFCAQNIYDGFTNAMSDNYITVGMPVSLKQYSAPGMGQLIFSWRFGPISKEVNFAGSGTFKNDVITRIGWDQTQIFNNIQNNVFPSPSSYFNYTFPGYGAYYSNPAKTKKLCYFTSNIFSDYINQYQANVLDLVAYFAYRKARFNGNSVSWQWDLSKSRFAEYGFTPSTTYTSITPNSFVQTLPGFVSGETIGTVFSGLFVSNDANTQAALGSVASTLNSYTLPNGPTVSLGSGVLLYLPLFLSDPGQPYVPAGWNFATADTIYSNKKQLMTDFSEQFGFTYSLTVPGS